MMGTRLWMSGEVQGDIGDAHRDARNEIESALATVLAAADYGALKEWAFLAIIIDDNFWAYDEIKKYRKKAQEFEFRLEIDHAAFKAADAIGHRKLIMGSLLRSIDEMRKLVPKGIDYDRLECDVRAVATAKGWLPDASQMAPPPPPPAPSIPEGDVVKKLYKRIKGVLHYEEAWTHEGVVTHHWGKVGHEGKMTQSPFADQRPYDAVQTVLSKALARGFTEVPSDKEKGILIEYNIDDFGETEDLNKLHALQDRLDETLGSLGLGFCDGNSIGSGTMEVLCYVVDSDIAIECIKRDLENTPFANYSAIKIIEDDDDA